MATPFGTLLMEHLATKGLSLRPFAASIRTVHSHVWRIIQGTRLPPLDAISAWADALELTGAERDRFLLAAELEHCPPGVRAHVVRIEAALNRAETALGRKRR